MQGLCETRHFPTFSTQLRNPLSQVAPEFDHFRTNSRIAVSNGTFSSLRKIFLRYWAQRRSAMSPAGACAQASALMAARSRCRPTAVVVRASSAYRSRCGHLGVSSLPLSACGRALRPRSRAGWSLLASAHFRLAHAPGRPRFRRCAVRRRLFPTD